MIRRSSSFNTGRIDHIYQDPHERGRRLILHLRGPDRRAPRSTGILRDVRPDEIYNLGAQSHVKRVASTCPSTRATSTAHRARCACSRRIRDAGIADRASTRRRRSEMFGRSPESPQTRDDAVPPAQPVRVAKVLRPLDDASTTARRTASTPSNGILFNHESPRRGETFVTRKITRAVGRDQARPAGAALPRQPRRAARLGLREGLRRGDVADAPAADEPDDYVVATGEMHSVRELLDEALRASSASTGTSTSRSTRATSGPTEVDAAAAATRRRRARVLGWRPRSTFAALVRLMLEHDLREAGLESGRPPARCRRR